MPILDGLFALLQLLGLAELAFKLCKLIFQAFYWLVRSSVKCVKLPFKPRS